MVNLEGTMLGDYLLLQQISRRGLADVYRAQQGNENYEVAIKVFRPDHAQRATFRSYFLQEMDKISHFQHPHVLPLLEYGEGGDLLYMVMPYISGGTLDTLLERVGGRLSAMQALPLVQHLCSALQYVHEHKFIHGNIKPSNLFVGSDGRMLLADFGVLRAYDDTQASLTRIGWGSAEYIAPEQSLGIARPASDIYMLGVVLFRILTGIPPFSGQTPVEVLLKHVRQMPPCASALVPQISRPVDELLQKALRKRMDERFSSAAELCEAFRHVVTVAPVAAPFTRSLSSAAMYATAAAAGPRTPFPPLLADPQIPLPGAQDSSPTDAVDVLPADFAPPFTARPAATAVTQPEQMANVVPWRSDEEDGPRELREQENSLYWTMEPEDPTFAVSAPEQREVMWSKQSPAALARPAPLPDEQKREAKLLAKQWLPLVVVVLLLLSLLAALLSSFLFSA